MSSNLVIQIVERAAASNKSAKRVQCGRAEYREQLTGVDQRNASGMKPISTERWAGNRRSGSRGKTRRAERWWLKEKEGSSKREIYAFLKYVIAQFCFWIASAP